MSYNLYHIIFLVRPEFTDTLAVKQSRHPILDIISFNLVPNNIVSLSQIYLLNNRNLHKQYADHV